jgi:hypothetical protein
MDYFRYGATCAFDGTAGYSSVDASVETRWLALAATVSGGLAFADPERYGIAPDGSFPWSQYSVSAESGATTLLGPITGALFTYASLSLPMALPPRQELLVQFRGQRRWRSRTMGRCFSRMKPTSTP